MRDFSWLDHGVVCLSWLLVLACAFGGGAWWMQSRSAEQIAQARGATELCASASDAQQQAIGKLKDAARANRKKLAATRAIARAAREARDGLQQKLTRQMHQRQQHLEDLAHEHADCNALDHMPLCPALARGLFHAADQGGDPTGGDHRDP